MNYLKLLEEQKNLKKNIRKVSIPKKEIISFGGMDLHEKMDFTTFSNSEITLAHTILHNLNSKKQDFFPKEQVKRIHDAVVIQMTNKGLDHFYFDKLDRDY